LILTDREIQIALERKIIVIDPPPHEKAFSSTSVDLTLDPILNHYKQNPPGIETTVDPGHQDYDHEATLAQLTEQLKIPEDGYIFHPNKLILAWTTEYINLIGHSRIAARVEGKSSLARLGIGVHITAPIIHAGFDGQIRLEMVNHGKVPVRLRAGMRICQLVFEQTLGTPDRGYNGRFSGQTVSKKG